jgi:cytochrome c oxidase assembly protein subunit 15
VELAQGLVGFAQYFTKLPEVLVAAHMAGACAVWLAALAALSALPRRPPAQGRPPAQEPAPAGESAQVADLPGTLTRPSRPPGRIPETASPAPGAVPDSLVAPSRGQRR